MCVHVRVCVCVRAHIEMHKHVFLFLKFADNIFKQFRKTRIVSLNISSGHFSAFLWYSISINVSYGAQNFVVLSVLF